MTVEELINELKKFPNDKEVFIWNLRAMTHSPVERCRQFTESDINKYLYMEDDDYSDDVKKILNNIIIYFED